jgi:hypothetical protein
MKRNNVPMSSLNIGGVFDDTAGQLRECLAERGDALGLHFKSALLGHGGVPATKKMSIKRTRDEIIDY